MDRPKPEIYIDGTRLTNVEGFSFFPDIEKPKVSEKLNFGEMKFSASLEFEGSEVLQSLILDLQKKATADRSYAITLAVMRGYGLAEVKGSHGPDYYICPRIPYRNIYVMPEAGWENRPDLHWGARKIEL